MEASALILTPYRNPPYRTPTPKSSVSPPPNLGSHSPKRKRADSEASSGGGVLQTNTSTRDFAPNSGVESPRSKVAERLRGLNLQQLQTPPAQSGDASSGARRKRLKRNPHLQALAAGYEPEDEFHSQNEESSSQPGAMFSRSPSPAEIEETPDCRLPRLPSSPPVSPERIRSLDGLPVPGAVDQIRGTPGFGTPERNRSPPPPPASMDVSQSQIATPFIFGSSTSAEADEAMIDQAALTWQDHEITGQNIDTSSPDDDGLGINGIGFRPTPAIAYARSQKRKQQVNEWRAREAREARQRRIERRRGASRGSEQKSPGMRRVVRFEGAA